MLDDQRATGRQNPGALGKQHLIGAEAVQTAVERNMGIVFAHFQSEVMDFLRSNVRRIGHDEVERPPTASIQSPE